MSLLVAASGRQKSGRHLSSQSGSNLLAFLSCLHSGKHKAPGPSAGCEAGDSLSVSGGFGGRFGLVSEALFLSHASLGQLGISRNRRSVTSLLCQRPPGPRQEPRFPLSSSPGVSDWVKPGPSYTCVSGARLRGFPASVTLRGEIMGGVCRVPPGFLQFRTPTPSDGRTGLRVWIPNRSRACLLSEFLMAGKYSVRELWLGWVPLPQFLRHCSAQEERGRINSGSPRGSFGGTLVKRG